MVRIRIRAVPHGHPIGPRRKLHARLEAALIAIRAVENGLPAEVDVREDEGVSPLWLHLRKLANAQPDVDGSGVDSHVACHGTGAQGAGECARRHVGLVGPGGVNARDEGHSVVIHTASKCLVCRWHVLASLRSTGSS